jgi:hypothetical protein
MKTTTRNIVSLSLLSLSIVAGAAQAEARDEYAPAATRPMVITASKSLSREQVKEDLRTAVRNGEMEAGYIAVVNGELDANRYPFARQAAFARAKAGDLLAGTNQ